MDDLIYSFLLQLDYPRASIIFDMDLLAPSPQITSGMKVPTFVVVDPETADPLAVIEVVDAASPDKLSDTATGAGAYASRLAGNLIQGFVIRVDADAAASDEQVKFYRIWPNSTLKQLSGKNFPDFEALRVSRKLAARTIENALDATTTKNIPESTDIAHIGARKGPDAGLYLPALALLLLIAADATFSILKGQSLLTLPTSVLAFGAAVLLTLPAAIRYARQ